MGASNEVTGGLVIIGGHEDKEGDMVILRRVVAMAGGKKARILILTTASQEGQTLGATYRQVFRRLGVAGVTALDINTREEANQPSVVEELENATGIFFTGGDQLRITSTIGGTRLDEALRRRYQGGAVVAGTSAGASAMSSTMIVGGHEEEAPKKTAVQMVPGMGLLPGAVVDQHFAQRGRIGRLLTAVAQGPGIVGIGIDEDTAILVEPTGHFLVLGSSTVTIIDGHSMKHSNVSESEPAQPLAITGVTLHVLPSGYRFDLSRRVPILSDPGRAPAPV